MVITLRTLCMILVTDMNLRNVSFKFLLFKNDLTISNNHLTKLVYNYKSSTK